MCKSIDVTEGNFRNQSLRATTATRMSNEEQEEQMVQEITGHISSIVRRYKHAIDSLKRKANCIIQGTKKCVILSKNRDKKVKRLASLHESLAKKVPPKSAISDSSDDDFMPLSQNIRAFKGSKLTEYKSQCHKSEDTQRVCEVISSMAPKKYKKIRINVEFINDSD